MKDINFFDKEKFLFVETIVRNRKGTVLHHSTSFIPQQHEDYNVTIDRYALGIRYYKPKQSKTKKRGRT